MTRKEILQAAEQLPQADLEALVGDFARLSASRQADRLSERETELFGRINGSVSEDHWTRYEQLLAKRKVAPLSDDERVELLRLGDEIEVQHADRIDALAELAVLRGVGLRQLMQELGLQGPRDVE